MPSSHGIHVLLRSVVCSSVCTTSLISKRAEGNLGSETSILPMVLVEVRWACGMHNTQLLALMGIFHVILPSLSGGVSKSHPLA